MILKVKVSLNANPSHLLFAAVGKDNLTQNSEKVMRMACGNTTSETLNDIENSCFFTLCVPLHPV